MFFASNFSSTDVFVNSTIFSRISNGILSSNIENAIRSSLKYYKLFKNVDKQDCTIVLSSVVCSHNARIKYGKKIENK